MGITYATRREIGVIMNTYICYQAGNRGNHEYDPENAGYYSHTFVLTPLLQLCGEVFPNLISHLPRVGYARFYQVLRQR